MAILRLPNGQYLDTVSGVAVAASQAQDKIKRSMLEKQNVNVRRTMNRIIGVDDVKIELKLLMRNRELDTGNGFLVEVYLSGTDGKLNRIYANEILDPLDDTTVRRSLFDYVDLEVDV